MDTVKSQNGVSIVLTEERWAHIVDGHPEMIHRRRQVLDTVGSPERILEGGAGELLAVTRSGERGWLVVVYKEQDVAGFVITAFRTTKVASLDRRPQIWP